MLDPSVAVAQQPERFIEVVARRLGDRSLADREWTVDTMPADAIAAWDELTPLAERGLGLWLEGLQRALRRGQA